MILPDPFFKDLKNDPDFLAIITKGQKDIALLRDRISEMEDHDELDR